MNLNNYVEIISLIVALIFYKSLSRYKAFTYFIPFLVITCIIEIYTIGKERHLKNLVYNNFLIVQYAFYSILFYKNLHLPKLKRIILIFFPVFLCFFLINLFFLDGFYVYNNYTSILGSFFIVIFVCFYFYEAIIPQKSAHGRLLSNPFFWVAVGVLVFRLGSVSVFAMFKFLSSIDLQNKGLLIFQTIIKSLNVILYLSFSLAFILCRNSKKTSSSPS